MQDVVLTLTSLNGFSSITNVLIHSYPNPTRKLKLRTLKENEHKFTHSVCGGLRS